MPSPAPLLRAPLLALACSAGLAACGSHSPTKQDVIARGNAVCAAADSAVRALSPPGNSGSRALAAYMGRVQPIVDSEARQLRALPRPAQDRAVLDRYLRAVTADATELGRLLAAARAGDSAALAQAEAALRASPAPALAERYGLAECAASAGTAVGS